MMGFNGNVQLYISSAGSGKSTVLVNQLRCWLERGAKPSEIAFITYTCKAADVAIDRLNKVCNMRLPYARTLHSFCFRQLKLRRSQICAEHQMNMFCSQYNWKCTRPGRIQRNGIDRRTIFPNLVSLQVSNTQRARFVLENSGIDVIEFTRYMRDYEQFKRENCLLDFDDMLQEYITQNIPNKIKYVCIDEAQDLTYLQWRACFQAFKGAKEIAIAGDPAQSIYQHNGGAPEVLLQLKGHQLFLSKSYRCPSEIVKYAQTIRDNIPGIPRFVCTSVKEGGEIYRIGRVSDVDIQPGESWMLLARTNFMLKDYITYCQHNYIPYYVKGKYMFTTQEIVEWRTQRLSTWAQDRIVLAREYAARNRFYPDPEKWNINIGTIHSQKGEEADNVVIKTDIGATIARSLTKYDMEEACVFYVAITRAKKRVFVMRPSQEYAYKEMYRYLYDEGEMGLECLL